ncbi:unnamed protein product [Linum tenue]|uniref:Uncharacterized protein n=1 Tax=Linum tenue TaxID=586396 RepID=A0AAV0PBY8_9ROSI|nr:unnamed protein product [Linum tenue]
MVLLDNMWDDVLAGPQPDRGLGRLRRIGTKPLNVEGEGSLSMPASPSTPVTPGTPGTPGSVPKDNVWRSVFNPGSNPATRSIGAHEFYDRPSQPNSPTVYDWYVQRSHMTHVKLNIVKIAF